MKDNQNKATEGIIMCDKKYKWLFVGLFAISILGCSDSETPMPPQKLIAHPVKMMSLATFDDNNTRVYPGVVVSKDQTSLSFRVEGVLDSVNVLSGQVVQKGDILASLDPIDYQLNLAKGQAVYNLAKVRFKRSKGLAKRKVIAEIELDKDRTNARSAEVAVQQLQANLGYTQIRAPFDGVISRVYIENYQFVSPKQAIMNLQSTEFIEVQFQATENMIAKISKKGVTAATAKIRFTQFSNNLYQSSFSEISSQPDPTTLSYRVTLLLEKPPGLTLLAGMSADVVFYARDLVAGATSNIKIPRQALTTQGVTENSSSKVWVFNPRNGQAMQRQIQIGVMTGDMVEVTAGFKLGDKLILSGLNFLTEGMLVTELKTERGL
jgi:RND family efflux transporter MFP subunit